MLIILAIILLAGSFILSAVLTALVRKSAARLGFVAHPSDDRYHSSVVPLGGGIAIFTTIAIILTAGAITIKFLVLPGRLDWLLNISNDGWFVRFSDQKVQPSSELAQHTATCAFRAVENRLAILRSVNTGISCMIDTTGRIKNSFLDGNLPTNPMDRTGMAGWFTDKVPIDNRVTFFSRYGQWLDISCQIAFVAILISLIAKRLKRNKTSKVTEKCKTKDQN